MLELLVRAVNEDLVDAGRKAGASSLRAQLKELFGRITSQVFFCSFLTRVTAQVSLVSRAATVAPPVPFVVAAGVQRAARVAELRGASRARAASG